jgi:SAM-dependent methyltransferase
MLARARENPLPGGGFKRASAERLPFKDGWFEAVVLRQVVHLLDRRRAFAELARVLAPRGRAVIATFSPDHFGGFWLVRYFPAVERVDRVRFPDAPTLAEELAAAGFGASRARRLLQRGSMSRAAALERLHGRYISTLHLLDEGEFAEGLAKAERELPENVDYELHWVVLTADRLG